MQSIRSLIAVGSLLVGVAAISAAQQPTSTPTQTPTPAVRDHGGRLARGHRKHAAKALLRGITLSDAERSNVQAVHAKYAPQVNALRTQLRSQAQNIQAARQRGDTATLRSIRSSAVTQRQQLTQAERNDIRGALSPGNQTKFDANAKRLQKRLARQTLRRGQLTKPQSTQP